MYLSVYYEDWIFGVVDHHENGREYEVGPQVPGLLILVDDGELLDFPQIIGAHAGGVIIAPANTCHYRTDAVRCRKYEARQANERKGSDRTGPGRNLDRPCIAADSTIQSAETVCTLRIVTTSYLSFLPIRHEVHIAD